VGLRTRGVREGHCAREASMLRDTNAAVRRAMHHALCNVYHRTALHLVQAELPLRVTPKGNP